MNVCDHISPYLLEQLINFQTHLIIQISVLVLLSLKCYICMLAITEYHFNTCNDSLGRTLYDLYGILNCVCVCSTLDVLLLLLEHHLII